MSRRFLSTYGTDIGLTCAVLVAAGSLCRLVAGGVTGPATGPFLATAATGAIVPAYLSARRLSVPVRVLLGTLAVALVALWTSAPRSTTLGLPTARTWHGLETHLRAARPVLRSFSVPLDPTEGVILLGALLVGIVAVTSSVLLHSADSPTQLRPGLALLGPLALLTFVCAQSSTWTAALPVTLFVGAGAATLSAARPTAMHAAGRDPGRPATRPRGLSAATAVTAAAMFAAALVALNIGAGADGSSGVSPGGSVAKAVPPTGLSLTSSLVDLEIHDANLTLFRAHSPYPTYWQVAVLSDYRNGVWVAGSATTSALHGAAGATGAGTTPAVLPRPAGTAQTFTSSIDIDNLSSHLIPVPPATISVTGPEAVTLASQGAVTASATRSGQRYSAVSRVPTGEPSAVAGNAPVSSYMTSTLGSDVELPALPASVKTLAEVATAGAQTPLSQAESLVNWFRSGKFHYSLHPPAPPRGVDPLLSFLTQTRTGTCEQFAGAYTVLARSLGLPTRVVVGFTAGHRTGPDEVAIRGLDAHAWPQVYLGPTAGWVSFEPTPQRVAGEVAPEGVVGTTGVVRTLPSPVGPPPPAPGPTTVPTPTTTATTTPPTSVPVEGHSPTRRQTAPAVIAWLVLPLAALAILLAAFIFVIRRRRRSPHGRSPLQVAELAHQEIDRSLRMTRTARPDWCPLTTYLGELTESLERSRPSSGSHDTSIFDQLDAALADALVAARVAEDARYAPGSVDLRASMSALDAATRTSRSLRNRGVRRLLARQPFLSNTTSPGRK